MPSRRQFIKLGLISGTVLGTSRVLYGPFVASPIKNPYSYDFIFLKELDLKTLSQFAPVFLKGSLKDSSQVGAALKKVDHAILGLSQSSQDELCQLFDLLNLP
ncbi:MAG: hypothetical protein HOM21_01635, partial [Halobacteriovoraceae bacterium]|nr:hypothetical protein [Halobacteriovoraceae bacterium]